MKKLIAIAAILLLSYNVGFSQKKADIGLMLGGATYIGDLNLETPFHMVRPAAKVFYRRNIHSRLAVRGNLGYYRLAGDDAKSDFVYQNLRNANFQREILETSAFVEFNFLKFEQSPRYNYISPYIGAGLGVMMLDYTFAKSVIENFTIPFGLGLKVGLNERFAIGFEYTVHKTFRDDIDKIEDWLYTSSDNYAFKQRANPQNNDWFTFFGVFLSYKLKDCVTCPANL
ncbi:MAG: hypothetical protein C0599_08635 [Salinivirgaceae bacterium]|nr:MAG: hypothetical protein C0599_08635 [Salinivirgaceae bacterium]